VLLALAAGEGADARNVRARAGLGDRERGDLLALDRRHYPALLLLLGAELEDRRRRDGDVRSDPRRHAARSAAGHLLRQHGVVHVVAALASVLLRILEAEEPELAHAREQRARELPRLLPVRDVGSNLALDEG